MPLVLHNPASLAHLEDLKDRLRNQLPLSAKVLGWEDRDDVLIELLVDVVRSMDAGTITSRDAVALFMRHRVPGFSFNSWLAEMLDEGVYLDTSTLSKAA